MASSLPVNLKILKFVEISFDNYQEYLRYTYNEAHESGRIVEIIETVKNQPRNIPFDFEFNTVEGKNIKSHVKLPVLVNFKGREFDLICLL